MASGIRKDDVCVVTGGMGGLGGEIVKELQKTGAKVAVIDIAMPEKEIDRVEDTLYLECNVSDYAEIENARSQIVAELGPPTIIINNAAVRRPATAIFELSDGDIQEQLEVNLGGAMKATRVFLPYLILAGRGFIVTIASALALVSPAGFAIYGASKAGLLGFHESLVYELDEYKDIKALLVCPGQLDTRMFSDIETPSEWMAPIVPPSELAVKIVKRIQKNKASTLYSPTYVRYLPLMRTFPEPVVRLLRKWAGVDKHFKKKIAQGHEVAEEKELHTPKSSVSKQASLDEIVSMKCAKHEPEINSKNVECLSSTPQSSDRDSISKSSVQSKSEDVVVTLSETGDRFPPAAEVSDYCDSSNGDLGSLSEAVQEVSLMKSNQEDHESDASKAVTLEASIIISAVKASAACTSQDIARGELS